MSESATNVAASPGGTLKEFARHLEAHGNVGCLSADGTKLWVKCSKIELLRLPMTCTDPVECAAVKELMRIRGIWVVDYLLEPSDSTPPNAFLYLCRDNHYDLAKLSKNGRKAVRRGLNNVKVRRISWAELAENGYAAFVETDLRHGYTKPSEASFRKLMELRKDNPFYEAWGAWQGEDLISWLSLFKVEDWTNFELSPSRDAALHNYANNALRYEVLRQLLTVEKRRIVVTGLSTIQPNLDPRRAYAYNTRMGFEAVPMHRVLLPSWWLRPLVANRPAARFWTAMSRLIPRFCILQKAAGLAQFMSAMESHPLAWAETEQKEQEDEPR